MYARDFSLSSLLLLCFAAVVASHADTDAIVAGAKRFDAFSHKQYTHNTLNKLSKHKNQPSNYIFFYE